MAWRFALLTTLLVSASAARADLPTPPPSSWQLIQSDPNPFCPPAQGTLIRIEAPQSARIMLEVLSPDGTAPLRLLVDQLFAAGIYEVAWDGTNSGGAVLGEGLYPYRLTARDPAGNIVFQDTKVAELSCLVAAPAGTWTAIKALYRRAN